MFLPISITRAWRDRNVIFFVLRNQRNEVHEWSGRLEIFSRPQIMENSHAIFASPSRYFTENSRWVPLTNGSVLQSGPEINKVLVGLVSLLVKASWKTFW